jgi:hypothetical protein
MASAVNGASCCLVSLVFVEDPLGSAAALVVAVVAPTAVVGREPGVGFGLELADRGEVTAMEGRTPALLEDGAVEALDHRVVVGRAGRDAHVGEALGRQHRSRSLDRSPARTHQP